MLYHFVTHKYADNSWKMLPVWGELYNDHVWIDGRTVGGGDIKKDKS